MLLYSQQLVVKDKQFLKTGTLSCSSVLPDSTEEFTMAGYPWEKGNAAYDGLKCYTDTGNFMKFYEGKKHHSNMI